MRIEESQDRRRAERPRAAGEIAADRRADSRRNPRLLPRDADGRIHLRAAGGQRRQARSRLRDGARITTGTLDKVRAYLAEQRPASTAAAGQPSRLPSRPAGAANAVAPPGFYSTTARNTCCSSRPAARRPRSAIQFLARTRQSAADAAGAGSSTPASATAPCCRG